MGNQQSNPDATKDDYDPSNDPIDISDLLGQEYPFENLVLEGGGAKACAYPAAFEILEEVGILKNIKRIAGTSGGAIAGSMLAIGFSPKEIKERFKPTWEDFADAKYGYLSIIPNLLNKFGWNPGDRALRVLEQNIADKTGNGKITFKELYDLNSKELCIVTTNVSSMSVEYFHPKTTPNVPISEAVRMSLSIPGYMAPFRLKQTQNGDEQLFVDGGVLCNYPIHAFDGWFLSMKKEDSFFRKLGTDEERFGETNSKTLGIDVYETEEVDVMKLNIHHNLFANKKPKRPNTTLARKRGPRLNRLLSQVDRKSSVLEAIQVLISAFRKHDKDESGTLEIQELEDVFESKDPKVEAALTTMFGAEFDIKTVEQELDVDENNEVSFEEFMQYLESKEQIDFGMLTTAVSSLQIDSVKDFLGAILSTWQVSGAQRYIKKEDGLRTIGIYTDYIKTMDMDMEDADLAFLHRQGKLGAVNYLRNYLNERHT